MTSPQTYSCYSVCDATIQVFGNQHAFTTVATSSSYTITAYYHHSLLEKSIGKLGVSCKS